MSKIHVWSLVRRSMRSGARVNLGCDQSLLPRRCLEVLVDMVIVVEETHRHGHCRAQVVV